MSTLGKTLVAASIALVAALPAQQAEAWWGWGPGYAGGWRHSYIYDPAYQFALPRDKQYIRDLYLHGPAYANWQYWRRFW